MTRVRLKIDVSGTIGDEAWRELRPFAQTEAASIGGCEGGGAGHHAANAPHPKGEWMIAEIRVQTPLLAQYAVAHYLEQDRVLDADVVD